MLLLSFTMPTKTTNYSEQICKVSCKGAQQQEQPAAVAKEPSDFMLTSLLLIAE